MSPTLPTTLALALFLAAPCVHACLHLPEDHPGGIGQERQEAVVFWNDGRELLVLRNDYVVDGDAPQALAWVVPVPALPDSYGVADENLFAELGAHFHAEKGWERTPDGARSPVIENGFAFGSDNLALYDRAQVGPYSIQPLKASSAEALNSWLTGNGFGAVPVANTRYYTEREWVWLCVRVAPQSSRADLSANGRLSPLRIAFASGRPVYPLKFSTHQGTFEVDLWLVTAGELPHDAVPSTLEHSAERVERWMPLPSHLDALQLEAAKQGAFSALENRVGVAVPRVTRLTFEVSGEEVAEWPEDLALGKPSPRPAPGDASVAQRGPEADLVLDALRVRVDTLIDHDPQRFGAALALLDAALAKGESLSLLLLRADIHYEAGLATEDRAAFAAAAADLTRALERGGFSEQAPEPDHVLAFGDEAHVQPTLPAVQRRLAKCEAWLTEPND